MTQGLSLRKGAGTSDGARAELGEAIGVEGLSAHDLRHAWETDAVRNGMPAFFIAVNNGNNDSRPAGLASL